MFEYLRIEDENSKKLTVEHLRSLSRYWDFDPHIVKYPAVLRYCITESNGYPYIEYDVDYSEAEENEWKAKAKELLEAAAEWISKDYSNNSLVKQIDEFLKN